MEDKNTSILDTSSFERDFDPLQKGKFTQTQLNEKEGAKDEVSPLKLKLRKTLLSLESEKMTVVYWNSLANEVLHKKE